jgi:hypothetical protein
VVILLHAEFPSLGLLIQLFLPNVCFRPLSSEGVSLLTESQCGEDARVQSYHYAGSHMPTFHPGRCGWYINWMEFRPHARTDLAYHGWATRVDRRIRDRRQHFEHCGSLRGLLHLPNGRVLGELGHHWVGVLDAQSDEGEESGMFLSSETFRNRH